MAKPHSNAGWRVNNDNALGFVHFSSFVESDAHAVADKQSRHLSGSRPDFERVAAVYRAYLKRAKNLVCVKDKRYLYNEFENGDVISPTLRRLYSISDRLDLQAAENPFAVDGPVYQFAKAHRLISNLPASTAHTNFKGQAHYSHQKRIIAIAFRLGLRVLGPDRYFNLMRYLAHYSSLLNQGDMLRK